MVTSRAAVLRSAGLTTSVVVACSITFIAQRAVGEEQGKASLPPKIDKRLRWFPADTETIVVAQSFKMPGSQHDKKADLSEPIWDRIQELSLCNLPELEESAGLDQLTGRTVSVAIDGGRDFQPVSKFGSLRYQGCSIVQFQEPLPDNGRRLVDAMRKEAKEVRTIGGKEVFVFPDRTVMESALKPKKWQGQYITLFSPDMLLCASSDKFLREVIERSKGEPADRALAADLPEWKYVDTNAPVWALRHIRRPLFGQMATGLTWCFKPEGRNVFEVTYLPVKGKKPAPLANIWSKPDLGARPSIEEKGDGTVTVTMDLEKGDPKASYWYLFPIYWSLGEVGEPFRGMNRLDMLIVQGIGSADEVKDVPNPEEANLPPDCLERIWSKEGEVYSGVAVAADGKTIVGINWETAELFDVSGHKTHSAKLPDRRSLVRWARLTGKTPGELIIFDKWGEGLIALSTDGTRLWDKTEGEGIDDVWVADLDGDEKDEVIVGYNGSTGLHAFGADGKRRWKDTSIGDVWHVATGDIDGDGKPEVLATSAVSKVHAFDADGKKIATLDPGIEAYMVRAFRLPDESSDRILVVGRHERDQHMVALNAQGDRLWETALPRGLSPCDSLAVAPDSQLAAAGSGNVVWVADLSTGKVLGARPKLGMPQVAWVTEAGGAPLLLVASTSGLAGFRVKEASTAEPKDSERQ